MALPLGGPHPIEGDRNHEEVTSGRRGGRRIGPRLLFHTRSGARWRAPRHDRRRRGGGIRRRHPDRNPWDYDILVQAVLATGLAGALSDTSTKYTVFAPNDRAFLRLVTALTGTAPASEAAALTTITSTFTTDQIKDILLYHVVAGKQLSPVKVITARSLTMANGGIVKPRLVTLRDESPALTDPRLVLWAINIPASNGVIHTIDRVLVPAM